MVRVPKLLDLPDLAADLLLCIPQVEVGLPRGEDEGKGVTTADVSSHLKPRLAAQHIARLTIAIDTAAVIYMTF